MHRSTRTRLSLFSLACATLVAAACSDDAGTGSPVAPTAAKTGTTATGGTDTSGQAPPTTPTSTGPVASIRVTPAQATLPVGYYLTIGVVGLDANGAVVAGKHATLRSSDAAIVSVVSDTGTIVAKAVGTAKIYATIENHLDSATITVVAAPPAQPGQPTPPTTPQPAVASFDLTVMVGGAVPGADTSRTAPVAGAVVTLTRVSDISGDTLTTPTSAGSGTTDANGAVSFVGLAGGGYTVDVTPPAGTAYQPIKTGLGPPSGNKILMGVTLQPKH